MAVDPAFAWVLALSLAVIFGWAAASKLQASHAFEGVVRNYRLLPEGLVRPVAYGLPPFEIALAVALVVPATRPAAAVAAALLLVGFGVAMSINVARGRTNIDCGCFMTALRQRIGWGLVLRNALLAAGALALLLPTAARPLLWLDAVTVVAATACLLLAYAATSMALAAAPAASTRQV